MEGEKDPFEGTAMSVGLTAPSVGSRPCIVNCTPQIADSTPPTIDSTSSSANLTPPRSDSICDEQEENDPFEGTLTPVGLTPPNSEKVLKIGDVYGNALLREFDPVCETSSIDISGSSNEVCENMKEDEEMYIIEDQSQINEKRNVLYNLISEAIMETNSGICTKGFCTLEEIYDYISKLHLVGLSRNWKDEVFDILYEKRTDFIHIPCENKPFQDGSWTLHPLVAKNHKPVKRSPLKPLNRSCAENVHESFSNISMDCNKGLNWFPVVRLTRCPRIDSLALAYVEKKTQVGLKTLSPMEASEYWNEWKGWKEQSEVLVEVMDGLSQLFKWKEEKRDQSRKQSVNLKRKTAKPNDSTTKKQKVSAKSHKELLPTSANTNSLSGGTKVTADIIGVWRGWEKVSTKLRDQMRDVVNQLQSNLGLAEVLKQYEQPIVTANQLGGLTRLYFKNPKVFYDNQKNNVIKERSNDEYAHLVQQQLKDLLEGYAYTMQEPPYSFAILIVMALTSSAKGKLVPEEIIDFIKEKFPFYQHQRNWQYSIYIVLRWNKMFNRRCSSNCTAKNEEHGGCWKIDLVTASELMGRALDSRRNQETEGKSNSPGVPPQQENDTTRETNTRVVNHQKSGVLFLHQSEERQQSKENLNLNNLTFNDNHPKAASEKMNGTSVIVFSKKRLDSPKADVVSKGSVNPLLSLSQGDVEAASESLLLLANSVESDRAKSSDVETYDVQTLQGKETDISCPFCQTRFTCWFMLENHVNNHLSEPCNPCFLCHQFFHSAYELWVHMKKYHANKDNLHISSALCHTQL